jgi:hypothetical protein
MALSSSHCRFSISLRDPNTNLHQRSIFWLDTEEEPQAAAFAVPNSTKSATNQRSFRLRLRRCSPTFRRISPPEVSLRNRCRHQVLPALPPGPTPSLLACRVFAKLLLPTRSKMTRTTKTHRMYQMSFAHITQKKVVRFHRGYHRTRRSPQWYFHHNRIINTVNLETITAATE